MGTVQLETSTVFIGTPVDIQNNLNECISTMLMDTLREEMKHTAFVL
jgi:hypothetical protein